MNLIQIIFPFFPFAPTVICVDCQRPVETRVAIPVPNVEGTLRGMRHPEACK